MCTRRRVFRQAGITLIEQIVFIIVVSVGVVGVLSTMGPSLKYSADPQVQKQQQAIAESLLAEILHQPFTFCDPDDDNATVANNAAGCALATNEQNNGGGALMAIPANVEARFNGNPGTQFDNVADYAGYVQAGVTDLASGVTLQGYTAQVAIARVGNTFGQADAGAVLQISVTVSGTGVDDLTLTGYRFRYAPRY